MEFFIFFCLVNIIGAIANITSALWDHNTVVILPWMCDFVGWTVATIQVALIIKGK